MLRIHSLRLFQFKNYADAAFTFPGNVTGICGPNGIGKTNLLDAIYYLSFTRSYFSRLDASHVREGDDGFRLEADIEKNGQREKAVCIYRQNGKKEFQINGQPYEKLADHIGRYPAVIIAPDDLQLLLGGSEERRRFMDMLLSQLDHRYLDMLIDYNRVLQQRNSLLKKFAENGRIDHILLDTLDAQLIPAGDWIFVRRQDFLKGWLPRVRAQYMQIAGTEEPLELNYQSPLLKEKFADCLRRHRNQDLAMARTVSGIHRDDIIFSFQDQPFKNRASQGQRKSLLFALKLSERDILEETHGFAPWLLLDDVFEKLDQDRMDSLLRRVCLQQSGQVWITDTHASRLKAAGEELGMEMEVIQLNKTRAAE